MIAGRNGSNCNGAAKLILRDRVLKTDLEPELCTRRAFRTPAALGWCHPEL